MELSQEDMKVCQNVRSGDKVLEEHHKNTSSGATRLLVSIATKYQDFLV